MTEIYFLAVAGVFGAIAGSFINALLYRFNTGRGMGGRSYCDTCGHTLHAIDLVPIASYLLLQGRCRYCKARISIQNLLVEVVALSISIGVYTLYPVVREMSIEPLPFLFWFTVWMTLLFVVVYDLRHTIIPWVCSGLLATLAFLSLFTDFTLPLEFTLPTLEALLAGPLLALPLFLLSLISGGRWMGWGDSALQLSLGWFLGLAFGATALMLAFWSGAAVGVLLLLFSRLPWQSKRRRLTMVSEIPFAPFLVFGMFLVFFFHVDFFPMVSFW
jgi:leader peptidase (prepilin peptidase) / N-methyltransferase